GMVRTLSTKLVSHTRTDFTGYDSPLPEKLSGSPSNRSANENGLLMMKSRSRNRLMTGGAEVTTRSRAGSVPLPLKCCRQVFIGGENRLPSCHSKVIFLFSSFQTEVAPFPATTNTISSNSSLCG